jgi:DHA1 family multidrug resistance protein-like MFS transporter
MFAAFAGAGLANLGFSASYPYLPLVVKEMGFTGNLETWVGLLVWLYFLASMIFTPLWGVVADHFGKKSMLLRAGFGMGIGFCLIPFGSSVWWFLPPFLLVGICNGYIPAASALVATNTPVRRIGSALTTLQAGAQVGNLIGPALGAFLATMLAAYRQLYWVSGLAMLGAGLVALLQIREAPTFDPGPFRLRLISDTVRLARVPNLMVLYVLSFISTAAVYGTTPVVSVYTLQLIGAGPAPWGFSVEMWVGLAAMAIYLSSMLALPVWGRLLDRYDPPRMLALMMLVSLLASLPLPFVQNPWQLAAARLVFGLFAAGLQPAVIRMIRLSAPQDMAARALYFGTMFHMLGNGLIPLVAGAVGPFFGLRAFFGLICLLLAVGLLMWVRSVARSPAVDYWGGN